MSKTSDASHQVNLERLPARKSFSFEVNLAPNEREELRRELGLEGLRKLRFRGTLTPKDAGDWLLRAEMGATAVQKCGISLEPVVTRIDEIVERLYMANIPEQNLDVESEITIDDRIEPLPQMLHLLVLLRESLSLSLPSFPRAPGAIAAPYVTTKPGLTPLSDADLKPFAALAELKAKLASQHTASTEKDDTKEE